MKTRTGAPQSFFRDGGRSRRNAAVRGGTWLSGRNARPTTLFDGQAGGGIPPGLPERGGSSPGSLVGWTGVLCRVAPRRPERPPAGSRDALRLPAAHRGGGDRKSTRLNSSHVKI